MSLEALVCEIAFTTDPLYALPVWEDVSASLRAPITIKRGRQHELGRVETGTLTLTLRNTDRRFDPSNTSSPYAPNVVPLRRIRISATWSGVSFPLFTGFVESWPPRFASGNQADVTITCVDALKLFARKKITASYPQQRTDERIAAVLDTLGWPAADRVLGVGQSTIQAATLENVVALQHLQDVTASENGLFSIDPLGRVRFEQRHARLLAATGPVFSDDVSHTGLGYAALDLAYDDSEIFNEIQVTRDGGVMQTATDAASQTRYWPRTLTQSDLLITSDNEALSAAHWLLGRYRAPYVRPEAMLIDAYARAGLATTLFALDLSSPVVVERLGLNGGTPYSAECFVEQITHTVGIGTWRVAYQLSRRDHLSYWLLGDATRGVLGSTTRLAY